MLESLISRIGSERGERQILDIEKNITSLKALVKKYKEVANFKVGDVVQWKQGLKNKKRPQYNEPCIVIEVLIDPIYDKEAPIASPYYNEKLDLKPGILNNDGDFLTFHYDKNRFEVKNQTAQ